MSAFYTPVARYYDAETGAKSDDLRHYSRLAQRYRGPILDVGCGTGRVVLHLAQAGQQVYGIDSNGAMLAHLHEKLMAMPALRERLTIVQGAAEAYSWQQGFALILLSYNVLMHFHEQEQQIALLQHMRAQLAGDGLLVIDLPNAAPAFAAEDSDRLTLERRFLEPASGAQVMLQSISELDRATQLLYVEWIYDEIDDSGQVKRLLAPHRLRYFFLAELRLLLQRCGFTLAAVYGDFEGGGYDAESERMIVHASPV